MFRALAGALVALELTGPCHGAPVAYVTNGATDTVTVVDTAGPRVLKEIAVGREPFGIVFSPDGRRAYVANAQSGDVSVLDTARRRLVGTIRLGVDLPAWVAMSPDGTYLYVTGERSDDVTVVSAVSDIVVGRIPVARHPAGIALAPGDLRAYVAEEGSHDVSVLDLREERVVTTIPVGRVPQGLVLSSDGTRLYVANFGSGTVSVIDTAGDRVVAEVSLRPASEAPSERGPVGIAVSPDGTRVFVADSRSGTVAVIEPRRQAIAAAIPVGGEVFDVAADPGGREVYVVNGKTGEMAVVDAPGLVVSRRVKLRAGVFRLALQPQGGAGGGPELALAGLLAALGGLLLALSRPERSSLRRPWPLLGLIFLLALGLRTNGLAWGLPALDAGTAEETPSLRGSFHLDEGRYLRALARVRPETGDFHVADFHWGTLQHHLVEMALLASERLGIVTGPWRTSFLDFDPVAFGRVFVIGRSVSALLGSLSVLLAYGIGRRLYGAGPGLWAALALAVLPLHVVNSHYLTSDVTMAFFLLLSVHGLLRALETGTCASFLATGLAFGLATAAKYNAIFLLPALLVGLGRDTRHAWAAKVWCGAGAAGGFSLGVPYAFVHLEEFWASAWGGRRIGGPGEWGALLAEQTGHVALYGLGLPFTALLVAGMARRRWRAPEPGAAALQAGLVSCGLSVAFAGEPMVRYTLPFLVLAVVPMGRALSVADAAASLRWAARGAVLATCAWSFAQVRVLCEEHAANRAFEWIERHVSTGARVTKGWPELPVLNPKRYRVRNVFTLQRRAECQDFLVDGGGRPLPSDYLLLDNLPTFGCDAAFSRDLDREYALVAEFRSGPRLFGVALPEWGAPHDWKYSHPEIRIYRKRWTGA